MDNPYIVELSPTSPAAPGNSIVTVSDGLNPYRSCLIWTRQQGATGGALDIYIQVLMNKVSPQKWMDYAHFTQRAAAAAAVENSLVLCKEGQPQTPAITIVGSDLTPALAAGSVVGGDWGF